MDQRSQLEVWKQWAGGLKRETYALCLACKDRRTPWYAKILAACVVGYALSPVDLIPDFIPVLGYLDDLILVPAGIVLVRRMIPDAVMRDCRERALARLDLNKTAGWIAAGAVVVIWFLLATPIVWGAYLLWR